MMQRPGVSDIKNRNNIFVPMTYDDLWGWPGWTMWPLTLTHDHWPWTLPVRRSNDSWNHIFDLVTLTFDLNLQGRPLTLTHVTFDLDPCDPWPKRLPVRWSNDTWKNVFGPGDLDLWPMTLTLKVSLGVIHINVLTKFHDPNFIGCWDMNFGQVTSRHTYIHTESNA